MLLPAQLLLMPVQFVFTVPQMSPFPPRLDSQNQGLKKEKGLFNSLHQKHFIGTLGLRGVQTSRP